MLALKGGELISAISGRRQPDGVTLDVDERGRPGTEATWPNGEVNELRRSR